jgi:hypothetical protein
MESSNQYDLEFDGDISRSLKREIERLDDYGFDPVKEAHSRGLLLPMSCAPVVEEIVELDIESAEVVGQVFKKVLMESKYGDTIALNVQDINSCKVIERVLQEKREILEAKNLKIKISSVMRALILEYQREQLNRSISE